MNCRQIIIIFHLVKKLHHLGNENIQKIILNFVIIKLTLMPKKKVIYF